MMMMIVEVIVIANPHRTPTVKPVDYDINDYDIQIVSKAQLKPDLQPRGAILAEMTLTRLEKRADTLASK